MGFVQGLSLAALAFILTAQMFRLEEAAKIHGMSFFSTLRRVTLPLASPPSWPRSSTSPPSPSPPSTSRCNRVYQHLRSATSKSQARPAPSCCPLLLIAYIALTPYVAPPSWEMLGRMSFVAFERVDWDLVFRGLGNTVLLVALVPTVTLVIAFCMSWLIVRSGSRYRYVLEFGAFLPHALPEVILAVAALLLSLFVLKGVIPLYGTVWLIAIVYVVSRLAFATRALNSSLLQIHKELEEAAYTAGLSPVRTSWRILVPLLRPTIMSVWIWSAILVYRELTVAVFLISHDNITLPAVIWSYWNSSATNLAAAVTLVMTGVLTPLILVFWWFGRRSLMQES